MTTPGAVAGSGSLHPPDNYALVLPGVYRCAFPKRKNFAFLQKLKLKTVLTLVLEPYPETNLAFLRENNIDLLQYGVSGNKEPFADVDEAVIRQALEAVLTKARHPILIHCNKGKHRTGCLIGALRKICGWALVPTLDEYTRFAGGKPRFMDQQFVEFFDVDKVKLQKPSNTPKWLVLEKLDEEDDGERGEWGEEGDGED